MSKAGAALLGKGPGWERAWSTRTPASGRKPSPPDQQTVEGGEPRLPGDLPPLRTRFFRARPPRLLCKECGRHFPDAEELNEHARLAHEPGLPDRPKAPPH
ncbi:MAG TPA: hypothetical protein VM286_07645 [Candidatus Thermoplasmatota archaeon]|nr:hypothetical protein [Candidatus Thermoplasmatota archaeon]